MIVFILLMIVIHVNMLVSSRVDEIKKCCQDVESITSMGTFYEHNKNGHAVCTKGARVLTRN